MRSFSLVFLALAACAESEAPLPLADFAHATDAERVAALQTATGFGAVWSTFALEAADADVTDADGELTHCPSREVVSRRPHTERYEADVCFAPSGYAYAGTIEIENPSRRPGLVPTLAGPMSVFADKFTLYDGESPLVFDGTWSRSETAPGADAVISYDFDAIADTHRGHLVGDMHLGWKFGVTHTTCDVGLRGSVQELGAFAVTCDVMDIGSPTRSGFVELHGLDTLRVDLTADQNGCMATWIDGEPSEPLCGDAKIGAGPGGELGDNFLQGHIL